MEKSERFSLFVQGLREAAAAASFDEARQLVESVLNGIEDRYSGAPFQPDNWRDDGRMYPPQDDAERKSAIAGVRVFRTRGHRLRIGVNGAIRITTAGPSEEAIVLDKAGKDGGRCPAE